MFNKLMSSKFFAPSRHFFEKHKEFSLYTFFGFIATMVSIFTFMFFEFIGFNELIANIFSWIISVFVAFITNTLWVFSDSLKNNFVSKIIKFYFSRLSTLFVEELILFIFITLLSFHSVLIKCIAQLIIGILNYILSKFFIYKNH